MMGSDPGGNFWYFGNTQQSNTTSFEQAKKADLLQKFKILQKNFDNKNYSGITHNMEELRNVLLYNGSFYDSGCGIISALMARSLHGQEVDVIEAYDYFSQ